jgi:inosine/xanthosine triphosphatase
MNTIIVASKNPVKIQAVKNGFEKMFPEDEIVVEGIAVASGVSHQPMTNAETEKGALTRAENARMIRPDAEYWVGIEGGVEEDGGQLNSFAWVAIASNKGEMGKGRTGTFVLPPKVTQLIREGKELGEADDIVFGQTNSKQKMGAVGLLTHSVIDRCEYYEHAVILACIRFTSRNKDLFAVRV